MTNETNGISLRRLKTFLTNLKNIFAEKNHSHVTSDITGLDTALSSKATFEQGRKADSAVQSVKIGTTEYKSGTTVTLPSYPTSLPASDVPSWAKQKTKPTYTASEIGLGNVGNFKAVSTVASQGLTDTEKSNARANIGAQVAGSYASATHNHDDKYQAKGSYASASHTHGNGDITSLDASKITSGTISIDRLPQGALERLTVVADDTARFKLTSSTIQKGDTVKVTSTGKMYYVVDETKLSTEAGYEVYAAGTAASVPWSGVTGKPSTYTPSSHTHDDRYYTESEIDSKLSGKANSSHTHTIANITNLQSTLDGKAASNHTHSQYLTSHQDISGKLDNSAVGADSLLSKITPSWTSIPTDDTYFIRQDIGGGNTFGRVKFSTLWSYIKGKADKVYAALTHTHTKSEVGLGNVDNTADANKSVKYATSAGSANNLNITASITGGDGNTTGYRLMSSVSIAAWSNYRSVFLVKSRHEGTGILFVSVGCNTATVSQANGYAEIKYFGTGDITSDSYQIYFSSDGKTAYLFEKYWDYSTLSITLLNGDFTVTNGTWMTSIATSKYGALKAQTQINNSTIVNGHTVNSDVPANAKFTDTTYAVATTSANGLMSKDMVSKLNGITSGANMRYKEVTQSTYTSLGTNYEKGTVYFINN